MLLCWGTAWMRLTWMSADWTGSAVSFCTWDASDQHVGPSSLKPPGPCLLIRIRTLNPPQNTWSNAWAPTSSVCTPAAPATPGSPPAPALPLLSHNAQQRRPLLQLQNWDCNLWKTSQLFGLSHQGCYNCTLGAAIVAPSLPAIAVYNTAQYFINYDSNYLMQHSNSCQRQFSA